MKRVLLVFASVLIGLTTASATEQHNSESKTDFAKTKKNATHNLLCLWNVALSF
ncbi:hypothetical protein N8013_02880 [Algibacter sp.]|nr:hypothetical protein [Algibacter sp.]